MARRSGRRDWLGIVALVCGQASAPSRGFFVSASCAKDPGGGEKYHPLLVIPVPLVLSCAGAALGVAAIDQQADDSGQIMTQSPSQPRAKPSWAARLRQGLAKSSARLSEGIGALFTKAKLDATALEELEEVLIAADLGVATAARVCERLAARRLDKAISAAEVRATLAEVVAETLAPLARPLVFKGKGKPHVVLIVGVNGTGKTTTIGKLAKRLKDDGQSVMLAAGDTFRAAAIEQLGVWASRAGAAFVPAKVGGDPAGLAYDAYEAARAQGIDVLLIDTAGRLQNKATLMAELAKIRRVLAKQDPTAPHDVLLVLDATTGQNALNQIAVFGEVAGVTGLAMTKLDGTARGGVLVAAAEKYRLPILAIGVGEKIDDLQAFDAAAFATALVGVTP
ncbi:MAG: signal recognition particle-docking protein FtsY [Pseudomonadota bacterium]